MRIVVTGVQSLDSLGFSGFKTLMYPFCPLGRSVIHVLYRMNPPRAKNVPPVPVYLI
jgi:hypothetical protein